MRNTVQNVSKKFFGAGLTAGRRLAERVVTLYKVAVALDFSYLYLIHHTNPITVRVYSAFLYTCFSSCTS